MRIAIPKESKNHEYRVAVTPAGVAQLCSQTHSVVVEAGAGRQIGFSDEQYRAAGAQIETNSQALWQQAELIIKVKEPQAHERQWLHAGQVLFAYLHLASDRTQTDELLASGASCIAFETVTDHANRLPLLAPMSEIAGRLAVQAGSYHLQKHQSGSGVLLGGIAGVAKGHVVIVGGGMVGRNALQMAIGLGARVTLLDIDLSVLRQLDERYGNQVQTLYASKENIALMVADADLLIGAVLIPGAAAPKLVTQQMVASMKAGSVIVDVAIDQGGCVATSRPTSHQTPTYVEHNVVHYCVTNMPGAVAKTATMALAQVVLGYAEQLANKGLQQALLDSQGLRAGLNVHAGQLCQPQVAAAQQREFQAVHTILDTWSDQTLG